MSQGLIYGLFPGMPAQILFQPGWSDFWRKTQETKKIENKGDAK